jgi:hypothetical protein
MAEVKTYVFDYKEVAEALIKQQGIHEGLWGIYMEFGIGAANIPAGPSEQALLPAAIVPVAKIGIQRFDKPSSLTVDAAEVNPASRPGPVLRRRVQEGRGRLETRKPGPRQKDGPTDEE